MKLHIDKHFICNKCDTCLKSGNIPVQALTIRDVNLTKCFFCEDVPNDRFRIYDKGNYDNNSFIEQIQTEINETENIICLKCHNLLLQECIVNCEICKNQTERRLTFVFDKKKYPTLTYEMIQQQVRHKTKYICKSCHKKLEPKVNCVCCKLNIDFHLCRSYKMENYDFNKHIVSRCIPNIDEDDSDKYICLSCHGRLEKTDNENPVVPYNLKNTCVNAAAKFLKCLQEKPEYVCTCCHRMMFRKSVKHFHVNEYRMDNYIVRKSLSYHYRMKVYNGNNDLPPSNQYIQHEWPQMMNTNGENQDFNYMDEYICIQCKTNLQLKNPNMPDQACANGLKLDDIPKDLSDLFTIE